MLEIALVGIIIAIGCIVKDRQAQRRKRLERSARRGQTTGMKARPWPARRWWVRFVPGETIPLRFGLECRVMHAKVPAWAWPLELLHRFIFGRACISSHVDIDDSARRTIINNAVLDSMARRKAALNITNVHG